MKVKTFFGLCVVATLVGCTPDDGAKDEARGNEARAAGDWRGAAAAYAAAAEKNPSNFNVRVSLALMQIETGALDGARDAITEAVALDPASAEARLVAGTVAYERHDTAEAFAAYDFVIGAKQLPAPLRAQAYAARAVVSMGENELDDARIALWRALLLDGRNAAAWYHLAYLSRNFGFAAAALEQYEIFARLAPANDRRAQRVLHEMIPALRNQVAQKSAARPGVSKRDPAAAAKFISEGENLIRRKRFKEALTKFRNAFEADVLSYPAAFGYAKLLAEQDRSPNGADRALAAYRAAIDAKPASQSTYLAAARCALDARRSQLAADILSQALAHDSRSKALLDLYIRALRAAGKGKMAAKYEAYRKEL